MSSMKTITSYVAFLLSFVICSGIALTLIVAPVIAAETLPETGVGGLVPCSGSYCDFCDLMALGNRVLDWMFMIVFMFFAIVAFISGVKLVTSGGNPGRLEDAKQSLTNVLIGILIMFSAWLIVDTLMQAAVSVGTGPDGAGGEQGQLGEIGPWNNIQCGGQTPTEAGGGLAGSQTGGLEVLQNSTGMNRNAAGQVCLVPPNPDRCFSEDEITSLTSTQVCVSTEATGFTPVLSGESFECFPINGDGTIPPADGGEDAQTVCTPDSNKTTQTCSTYTDVMLPGQNCAPNPTGLLGAYICSKTIPLVSGCLRGTCNSLPQSFCKSAASCSVSPSISANVTDFHQAVLASGVTGARITESMPPTRSHKAPCHNNGTCFDYSKAGGMTPTEVLSVIRAAEANGLRPVYEVRTQSQKDTLVQGGVPSDNVIVLGTWISAPHFSIYGE